MPLPSPEDQLRTAIAHFQRDGLVIIKDRPGGVADLVERWAEEHGIRTERRERTLGRARHWEIRRR